MLCASNCINVTDKPSKCREIAQQLQQQLCNNIYARLKKDIQEYDDGNEQEFRVFKSHL